MKHTRWIAMLLALVMGLGLIPARVSAAEVASGEWGKSESDNVKWSLDSNGTMTISGTGEMEDCYLVNIDYKDEEDWYRQWDQYQQDIKAVVIEEGITYVGNESFSGAKNLKSVKIANSVKRLGRRAFSNCDSLTSITFGTGLESTDIEVFSYCDGLVSVTLPNSNVDYGNAFMVNCTGLKNITFPQKMTEIGASMFEGCSSLEQVVIPNNIKTIGGGAFESCYELESITLPEGLTIIGTKMFQYCESLESVVIPDSVTEIEHYAFSGCGKLTSVTLPLGLLSLGYQAFDHCNSLKSITIPTGIDFLGSATFRDCVAMSTVKFLGSAPNIPNDDTFSNVKAKVQYPADLDGWTSDVMKDYDGDLTWVAYCSGWHRCDNTTVHKAPTCTVPGSESGTCSICGEVFTREVPAKGTHSYDQGVVIEAATCVEEGTICYTCTECGDTYTEIIPVGEHSYDEGVVTKEPACAADGERLYTCALCGVTRTEVIYALSHDYDEGVYIKEPTCTEYGELEKTCRRCGEKTSSLVSRLDHDYSVVKPVYDETGRNHVTCCSGCGALLESEACTFDGGTVVKEATLDEFGVKKHTCTLCGGSYETAYIFRISGKGRCETAYAAADLLKETLGIAKFDTIIIASGENFADALSGSFLAARKNAPILLFRNGYEDENLAYITENLASGGKVYILGGTAAVPQSMEDALEGFDVMRLSGKTRFDTNLKILEEAGVVNEEILVCTGWNFADCLSASATGLPILLVDNKAGKLTENQINFLSDPYGNDFTIIGGSAAVNVEIENALWTYGEVVRLSGKSRYETSVLVAERFFTDFFEMADPDAAILTNGQNFPDGLCGGPLAYALKVPVLLVNNGNEKAAAAYVAANGIAKGAILGGTAAVSDSSGQIVFGLE